MVETSRGIIDAKYVGRVARLANHSCEAKCELEEKVFEYGSVRVLLRPANDIPVGTEIMVDYRFRSLELYIKCTWGFIHCRKWDNLAL